MNRWVVTALILSLALNLGFGIAWFSHQRVGGALRGAGEIAHHGERGRLHSRGRPSNGQWAQRRAHRLHRELGLEPERRDRLHASLEALEPEIAEARWELLEARRGFAAALHVEKPDREEVMRVRTEVSRRQARLDSLVAEALLRESTVLNLGERMRSGPWPDHREGKPLHEEKRR